MNIRALLLGLFLSVSALHAAVTVEVTGNIAVAGGTITLPEMTFTMTSTANNEFLHINFIDWTTTDGNANFSISADGLTYKVNGGADVNLPGAFITDNLNATSGVVTPNTGYVGSTSQTFTASTGQTVTIPGQSFTVPAAADFNPLLNNFTTFSGTVYITDNLGNAWANPIVIPEPSSYAVLSGFGLLGLFFFLRRDGWVRSVQH